MRDHLLCMREEEKLSQQEIARRAGISQAYYSFIEQGKRQKAMSLDTMQKLARAFDLQPTDIFQLEAKYQQDQAG